MGRFVYDPIHLTWKGQEYVVETDYKLIQAIEKRVSILGLVAKCQHNDPPVSKVADVVSFLLIKGGCKPSEADPEEIYLEMMEDEDWALLHMAINALWSLAPRRAAPGNSEPPSGGRKRTKRKGKKNKPASGKATT